MTTPFAPTIARPDSPAAASRRSRAVVSTLTTSLLAALVGASGCGPSEDPLVSLRADELEPGGLEEGVGPILSASRCLYDFAVELHHADATTEATKDVLGAFQKLTRPGDLVDVSFKVDPTCTAQEGPARVTLASYTEPHIVIGLDPPERELYDVAVGTFTGGEQGALSLRIPACDFAAAFAHGEPIARLGEPQDTYAAQNRLIAGGHGETDSCAVLDPLAIERFDTVGPAWGDAPVTPTFGWKIAAHHEPAEKLTCSFDFDRDGELDEVVSPCPADTAGLPVDALPGFTFGAAGRHAPLMFVSDGERSVFAQTTVFANHLEFADNVRFPEEAPAFIGAQTNVQPAPATSSVVLEYDTALGVPFVKSGDIVVGRGGASGYMLHVTLVQKNGRILTLHGVQAKLTQTVKSGFFGVRDLHIDTADARCVSPECADVTVTPVAQPPGGDGQTEPELMPLEQPPEGKMGVKFAIPFGEALPGEVAPGEIEIFAGLHVKEWVLDLGWFSIDELAVEFEPTVEVAIASKAGIEEEIKFGAFQLGFLPCPLPISMMYSPVLNLEATLKFSAKLTASAAASLIKRAGEWAHDITPSLTGAIDKDASPPGAELATEVKATMEHQISAHLGFAKGPYVAPTIGVAAKATLETGCKLCTSIVVDGGVKLGLKEPWDEEDDLVGPYEVKLLEVEAAKSCLPPPDVCEPGDGGGGGGGGGGSSGGSWGDVHLISHDGLLFDFQAGGEFVLVRSTDPAAPLEVQTRQEPMKRNNLTQADLSLSYNTAVATKVDGQRVGLYARHDAPLVVGGQPTTLDPGAALALGEGSVARSAEGNVYTFTYPAGDVMTVKHNLPGQTLAHFDVKVALAPARAGNVEGLLGDADGDPADDVALPGGAPIPQPVTFEGLYRGPSSFTSGWRVAGGSTLFDYGDGSGATKYREYPYSAMPLVASSAAPPHAALAEEACAACPPSLHGACITDVGYTGEPAFAQSCLEAPGLPVAEITVESQPYGVYPLHGSVYDCDDRTFTFRAPGAADADKPGAQAAFEIAIDHWQPDPDMGGPAWEYEHAFSSLNPPYYGWGEEFHCKDIGLGWGECTLLYYSEGDLCNSNFPEPSPKLRWSLTRVGEGAPAFTYEFNVDQPDDLLVDDL